MSSADDAETETARRCRTYVESNGEVGMDWRTGVPDVPPDTLSLGTMESNGDRLTASRMKKRGMSWSEPDGEGDSVESDRGVGEALSQEEDRGFGACRPPYSGAPSSRVSDRADASVPALTGPSVSKPCT